MFFGVTFFVFVLNFLFPTDVINNMSGMTNIPENQYQELIHKYKLNESFIIQYGAFLERLWTGDWGTSFINNASIYHQVFRALPATIELSLYALLYSFIVAIPFGVLAASSGIRWLDKSILGLSIIGFSMPIFWLALIMILVFSINLGWFPTSGRLSLIYDIPYQTGYLIIDIILSESAYKLEALLDAFRHLI